MGKTRGGYGPQEHPHGQIRVEVEALWGKEKRTKTKSAEKVPQYYSVWVGSENRAGQNTRTQTGYLDQSETAPAAQGPTSPKLGWMHGKNIFPGETVAW